MDFRKFLVWGPQRGSALHAPEATLPKRGQEIRDLLQRRRARDVFPVPASRNPRRRRAPDEGTCGDDRPRRAVNQRHGAAELDCPRSHFESADLLPGVAHLGDRRDLSRGVGSKILVQVQVKAIKRSLIHINQDHLTGPGTGNTWLRLERGKKIIVNGRLKCRLLGAFLNVLANGHEHGNRDADSHNHDQGHNLTPSFGFRLGRASTRACGRRRGIRWAPPAM